MLLLTDFDENVVCRLIESLREREKQQQEILQKLFGSFRRNPRKMRVKVSRFVPQKLCVVGVDGGMAQFSLRASDVVFLKSIASVFHYVGGKLLNSTYFPSETPVLNILGIHEPVDHLKLEVLVGMERQINEIRTARRFVEKNGADLLLLDGSVVPQYAGGYRNSLLEEEYCKLIEEYVALYKVCVRKGIFLAGFVKDGRGKRFLEELLSSVELEEADRKILENSRDSLFLNSVIDVGERTKSIPYAKDGGILDRLDEWKDHIYLFYMKSSPLDIPFRVEFVEPGGDEELTASCLASWILFLSSFSEELTTPPVLLEADFRARMREEEVAGFRNQILSLIRDELGLLRRERKLS